MNQGLLVSASLTHFSQNQFLLEMTQSALWLANFLCKSHIWENSLSRDLGQKGPKVGRAVGKNQLFCILLKIIYFLIFCIKLEGIKGYKLAQTSFLEKILVLPILAIFLDFWSKNQLFCILLKIGSLDFFDILHEVKRHY